MDIEQYRLFTIEDFVLDDRFTEWVLHPQKDSDVFWSEFLSACPVKGKDLKDAAFIVRGMQVLEEEIPAARLDDLFIRIQSQTKGERKRSVVGLLKYAAVMAGLIGITGTLYLLKIRQDPFPLAAMKTENSGGGRIILSDGSSIVFNTPETVIQQTASGEFLINSDTVNHIAKAKENAKVALNQVIIPYGKRSQVTLPDGSHIWLNSGSQLSYPAEFSDKSREVYLSGEAFFEVATDSKKPFYVITKDVKIKVLGTRFNVSAYDNEEFTQAVLLEGKVNIGKNWFLAKTEEMVPGDRSVYHKKTESFTKGQADVNYYTSWLYGYLIFENEPSPEVFRKLERYYNQTITVDSGLNDITFSGKLDLKEDIEEVLASITYTSMIKISREGAVYKVKR
jgi:transmembrane sensor